VEKKGWLGFVTKYAHFLKQILLESRVSQTILTSALLKSKRYRFNGNKIISMASASTQYIYYKYNVISNVKFFKLFLKQQCWEPQEQMIIKIYIVICYKNCDKFSDRQIYLVAAVFVKHNEENCHHHNHTHQNERVGHCIPNFSASVRTVFMEWGIHTIQKKQ